jgi:thiosulfate/3-mercaptopyruvate sulfurtransferase
VETVLESVARTNRVLAVEEGPRTGGWATGLLGAVAEQGLHDLDDAWILATDETPVPYSPTLEDDFLPDADAIVASVRETARRCRVVAWEGMVAPIHDSTWVREHRDAVVLADVRWYLDGTPGRPAYDAGHIPGAVYVDLDEWLAAPGSAAEGRHPLPDPGAVSPRAWRGWASGRRHGRRLRRRGRRHRGPARLDAARHGPRRRAPRRRARRVGRPAREDAGRAARRQALHGATLAGGPDRLDRRRGRPEQRGARRRQRERYRGDPHPIDPRAGHIPGARNLPARENLDESGRLLPVDELRRRLGQSASARTRPRSSRPAARA